MSIAKRNIVIGISLMLLFLTSITCIQPSFNTPESSTGTIVKVEPALIEYTANATGQEFTVDVKVINVTELYGFDIVFSWNTTFLEYVNHTVKVPRDIHPDGVLWAPALPVKDEVDAAGRYWIAYASMHPASSFNGSGTFFNMTFKVKYHPVEPEPTAYITLKLETIDLSTKAGTPIPHVKEDGTVVLHQLQLPYILLKVDPQITGNLSSCTDFDINILIAGVGQTIYNLTSFNVTLSFNSTLINAKNITEGTWPREYAQNTTELLKQIDNANGKLTYALEFVPPINPNASTSGILFKATFHVIFESRHSINETAPSCILALGPTSLMDSKLGEVIPQTENGTYVANRPLPTVEFSWSSTRDVLPKGQLITFNASESYHKLGLKIILYEWNFGPEKRNTTEPTINYTFLVAGRQLVILNITDEGGFWNITSAIFTIIDPPTITINHPVHTRIIFGKTIWINGTIKAEIDDQTPAINDTRFDLAFWNSTTGAFAFKNSTNIPDGAMSLLINFTDKYGYTDEAPIGFTLRNQMVVRIDYPSEGTQIIEKTIWVNGTITVSVDHLDPAPVINDTRFTRVLWERATGEFAFSNNTVIPDGPLSLTLNFTDRHENTASSIVTFTVGKLNSSISIDANPKNVTVGSSVTISGNIKPLRAFTNVTITANGTVLATVQTDQNGNYTYVWKPDKAGTYELKASWLGDANTNPAESDAITIRVEPSDILPYIFAGIVIIILIAITALYFLKIKKKT